MCGKKFLAKHFSFLQYLRSEKTRRKERKKKKKNIKIKTVNKFHEPIKWMKQSRFVLHKAVKYFIVSWYSLWFFSEKKTLWKQIEKFYFSLNTPQSYNTTYRMDTTIQSHLSNFINWRIFCKLNFAFISLNWLPFRAGWVVFRCDLATFINVESVVVIICVKLKA